MSDYTTANTTSLTLEKFNTEPVMTIHPDGRVTVSDKFKPDEAASKVVEAFKTRWMADPQATKIRELQSDVNELKELVEYLQDRIKKLKKAGDEVSKLLGFSIGNDEDEEWACSLQCQNLARCHNAISEWDAAKDGKL